MAERPDLDAMRERANVMKAVHWFCAWAWERTYSGGNSDREALLTYCRKLEAENQRLRQQIKAPITRAPKGNFGVWPHKSQGKQS